MTANLGFTLRPDQWHLLNEGQTGGTPGADINVIPAWADYTGEGIKVVVFDSGVDTTHPDLAGNYLSEFSFDFLNNIADGSYLTQNEYIAHGTIVAGFIAADGTQYGLRGVAYDAKFTSYAEFNGEFAYTAFGKAADDGFDVMNNSWGTDLPFINSYNGNYANIENIEYAVETGRGGLGLNIVFAAGNSYELPRALKELGYEWSGEYSYADANADNPAASRFTITVAALDADGTYAADFAELGYTTPGAPILISAPGSKVVSTDIQGELGDNPGEAFAVQYGTSFAAPIVSGVVALMLEANPNLGYRDVQEILAYSARLTDLEDESWQVNGAVNANGGGLSTNDNYGFGFVDATAAVRLAETWHKQSVYANEQHLAQTADITETQIPDGGDVSFTFDLAPGVSVENIELGFAIEHEEFGDLVVTLISPSGTESTLLFRVGDARATELTKAFLVNEGVPAEQLDFTQLEHVLSSNDFWGEDSGGTWTLLIEDAADGNVGSVHGLELRAHGSAVQDDKTFIYTNDYALLAGQDAGRKLLDAAGGTHTLNMAAVTDGIEIDLSAGTGIIAGQSITISDETEIGTVLGGDGNDFVALSQSGGIVAAGRGNDTIEAFGTASIDGGVGFDRVMLSGAKDAYQVSLTATGVSLVSGNESVAATDVQYFDFAGTADDVLIVVDDIGAQLARFYDLLLGRVADFEGLAYWNDAMQAGLEVAGIASSFAASSEFAAQGEELSASEFVALLYDQILGRGADEAGVGYWVSQIDGGLATVGDVAAGFALSAEAAALTFDHIVVTTMPDMQIA
ncbi:S8 family serine peptidase [Mesorhizobium sp. CAU 1741]|uniref:S8 family serine peptidase n=1 Tax=Mesorhizobium sp. CAU 1741 TaxID=3140366 RepID=UPI00325ADCEF